MVAMAERSGSGVLTQLSDDLAAAVERGGEGTVTVNARRRMPASGIVWESSGLIVTANHVVERDDEITVGLADGREATATLLGRDPGSDLALLKADATDFVAGNRATNAVKIGHLVLAVARPGPSGPMASFGVVSAVGDSWRTHQGGTIEGFIRADVAMLPGFSGGPLVDTEGNMLGLNSSAFGRGAGLTLPLTAIDKAVAALQTHGKVRRGFLGIGAQAVRIPPALVASHGLSQDRGLLIVNVEPDGPAERDGLMLGDVLISIEGAAVAEVEELQGRLSGDLVGRPVAIRLIRGGEPRDLSVTVGERT